jgi:spore coat polysaccharide biosynthesis protein SpsF
VVDEVVAAWRTSDADYVANVIEPRTYPVGMDTEVVSVEALLAADAEASDPYDREHVTPFVRSRPERFPQEPVRLQPPRPDVRLTLDTPEDLERLRAVVAATGPKPVLQELIAAADSLA